VQPVTTQAPSSRFRRDSRLDALARAWPSSGVLGRVRRLLKPMFETAIGWRGGGAIESRFPGGEVVRLRAAWRNLSWNPEEYAAFRAAVRPGDIVVDAGANVGGYALLFGQWVGPGGRVYAFEPDPRAFAALVDHVTLNGLADRVMPIAAALGNVTGPTRLRLASASGLSRVTAGAEDDAPDATVPSIALDDFCARESFRASVIKIDVEGAELAVLRGARQAIAAMGSDVRLFVEMHPAVWTAFGYSADDIVAECRGAGLSLERLDGSRAGLWDVEGVCLRLRRVDVRT
jgi:FkbM family methyltransferase